MRRLLILPLILLFVLGVVAPVSARDHDERRDAQTSDRHGDDRGGSDDRHDDQQGSDRHGDDGRDSRRHDDGAGQRQHDQQGSDEERDNAQHHEFPDHIALPNGFAPEGIAIGRHGTFFTGSLAGAGILRGDLRSGATELLAPSDGRTFVGMKVDRYGRLWVAGGPDGTGYVIDARTGETLSTLQLAASSATFVNDVVVTKHAAWFTDSQQPIVYRVPIGEDGELGAVETIDLAGQIEFVAGEFNLNGIDATRGGRSLVVVNSFTGRLYAIDAESGTATEIDLGGATLTNGDGILLIGRTLFVVRNQLNEIAVVRLRHSLTRGEVVGTLTSDDFDVPTTIARFGHKLYAVNARFGTDVTPETEYWVTRVKP